MSIKTTLRHHIFFTSLAKAESLVTYHAGKGVGEQAPSSLLMGVKISTTPLEGTLATV